MEKETQGNEVALYLAADKKIEKIKDQVGELSQRDLNLSQKIDHLTNRIDFGVAKTGQKTLEKVTEMAVKLNDFEHEMAGQKATLNQHDRILGRIVTGIFWITFVVVFGGLVGFGFHFLKGG